jgi:hypothetical protein
VTIDQNGVTVAKQGALPASVVKTLTDTVNTALKQSGISIYVTKPSKLASGPQISLSAGNLIVLLNRPGYKSGSNDTGMFLELGGANITANASAGYVAPTLPLPSPASSPATSSSSAAPSVQMPPPISSGTTQEAPPNVAPPQLATKALTLPGALSSWWFIGGIVLALLAGLGLWFLPGQALAAAGAGCRNEEES